MADKKKAAVGIALNSLLVSLVNCIDQPAVTSEPVHPASMDIEEYFNRKNYKSFKYKDENSLPYRQSFSYKE
jgi:hypothetical protein